MRIETERLIIRSIQQGDEIAYAKMARDGSLSEIGFELFEIKMYKDACEEAEDLYRFYTIKNPKTVIEKR